MSSPGVSGVRRLERVRESAWYVWDVMSGIVEHVKTGQYSTGCLVMSSNEFGNFSFDICMLRILEEGS